MTTVDADHKKRQGDALGKARRAKDLTQERLAAMLGVHRMTVSRAEAGTFTPHAATLAEWARICGVSLDDLLRVDDVETTDAAE